MLNSVSESVSWGPQFGSLEDRNYIRAFGCFPISNKGKLRLFEHRGNMLKIFFRYLYLFFRYAEVTGGVQFLFNNNIIQS